MSESRTWEASRHVGLDVAALTRGRPCCAGVLVVEHGGLLTTLSSPHGPAAPRHGNEWYVGGVGGGQEPHEDVWGTAQREAREELGVPVELLGSPITHVQDFDDGTSWTTTATDAIAPFALQRVRNEDATRPFKPGLPTGPFTYFALFLARFTSSGGELDHRGDEDIAALFWMPLDLLTRMVDQAMTVRHLVTGGGRVATGEVAPDALARLSPHESLALLVAPLVTHLGQAATTKADRHPGLRGPSPRPSANSS